MKVIERRVYRGTPEHALYLSARFGGGRVPSHLSFEFDGHRWAYRYSSFCDKGEYDLIWRPDEDAGGKPADGVLPPMPEPEDYCGDHNLGVKMFSREQMQAYALAALERFGAGGGEPVYAFRRKGQDSFCTCDENRYLELSENPNLFEVKIFYTSPTDLRAEYLRGLDDAKRAVLDADDMGSANIKLMKRLIGNSIEALKGKQ